MAQRPLAVGLFLCEQVIVERGTGNITLVNCFYQRAVRQFPSEKFPFVVFALLTGGSGTVPLELTIQRLDTLEEVHGGTWVYDFGEPLQKVRFILRIENCSFPVAGDYQVTLFADGEPIAQNSLRVALKGNST